MNQSPRPKNTPGRRRQGRNNNTPQKSYVSENDLPAYQSANGDQHFASPNTPLKPASAQKPRAKNTNKNRNKNASGSPNHQSRQPSNQFIPLEAPAAIFAGATFHASPAPSSLPMPSFLARSSADSPLAKASPSAHATPSPQQEPSPPSTDSEDGQNFAQPPAERSNDSPLEVFFRAQRAEKAKDHRAKSANAATPTFAPGPFSPPHAGPMEVRTAPRAQGRNESQTEPHIPRSASGISAVELDGTPGRALGPAFSTPYSERIRAARPSPASSKAVSCQQPSSQVDESQALLRMLHHGKPMFPQQPTQSSHHQHQPQLSYSATPPTLVSQQGYAQYRQAAHFNQYHSQYAQQQYDQSSYGSHAASTRNSNPAAAQMDPSAQLTFGASSDGDQISKMEASLRQVLKLDSST